MEKICKGCNENFNKLDSKAVFCSKLCRQRFNRKNAKICSFSGCNRKSVAKTLCNTHWCQQRRRGKMTPIIHGELIEERFWRQVNKEQPNGCWKWLGPPAGNGGYGQVYFHGKRYMAHRFSYQLHKGNFSDHLQMDHLCRNRLCVNPNHLQPVIQRTNVKRMHAFHDLKKEIEKLREIVINLGGDPGADIFTV